MRVLLKAMAIMIIAGTICMTGCNTAEEVNEDLTPTLTATEVEPTLTEEPTPTSTPVPTSTPEPTPTSTPVPTATSTPVPTATSTPTPTSTPIPTNTPTPTPVEKWTMQVELKEVQPGYFVEFGSYEQDNDTTNGQEAIEWMVLDVKDGEALLMSRYILDAQPYHTENEDVTWDESYLRQWMNSDFYQKAFNEEEQQAVVLSKVSNASIKVYESKDWYDQSEFFVHPPEIDAYGEPINSWKVENGSDTEDYVFAISAEEYAAYFPGTDYSGWFGIYNDEAATTATDYAVAQGIWVHTMNLEGENGYSWYNGYSMSWLRSKAFDNKNISIAMSGQATISSFSVDEISGVRPAIRVKIK